MLGKLSTAGWSAIFITGLWLAGCSTATKPKVDAPSVRAAPGASKPDIQKAQGSTSLEDLRRGQSAVTPKESPLKEIYFDFDNYDLRPASRETLKASADWLKKNQAATVIIEGHCDERGTAEYNIALGAKRAQTAHDYLVNLGIAAKRLSTISYGKEVPVCREHNEECWQKNRRDRFVVRIGKPGV